MSDREGGDDIRGEELRRDGSPDDKLTRPWMDPGAPTEPTRDWGLGPGVRPTDLTPYDARGKPLKPIDPNSLAKAIHRRERSQERHYERSSNKVRAEEAAERLGLPFETVVELLRAGKIEGVELCGHWWLCEAGLERFRGWMEEEARPVLGVEGPHKIGDPLPVEDFECPSSPPKPEGRR